MKCFWIIFILFQFNFAHAVSPPKNYPDICKNQIRNNISKNGLASQVNIKNYQLQKIYNFVNSDKQTIFLIDFRASVETQQKIVTPATSYICLISGNTSGVFLKKDFINSEYGYILNPSLPITGINTKTDSPSLFNKFVGQKLSDLAKSKFCEKYKCKLKIEEPGQVYQLISYFLDSSLPSYPFYLAMNKNGIVQHVTIEAPIEPKYSGELTSLPLLYINEWFNLIANKSITLNQYNQCIKLIKSVPDSFDSGVHKQITLFEDSTVRSFCYYDFDELSAGYRIVLKNSYKDLKDSE